MEESYEISYINTLAAYRATAESFIYVLTENNLEKIKKTIPFKTKYE